MPERLVVALFDTRASAEAALGELRAAGVPRNAMSLVAERRAPTSLLVVEADKATAPRILALVQRHRALDISEFEPRPRTWGARSDRPDARAAGAASAA
jgi:hypothetical protein